MPKNQGETDSCFRHSNCPVEDRAQVVYFHSIKKKRASSHTSLKSQQRKISKHNAVMLHRSSISTKKLCKIHGTFKTTPLIWPIISSFPFSFCISREAVDVKLSTTILKSENVFNQSINQSINQSYIRFKIVTL